MSLSKLNSLKRYQVYLLLGLLVVAFFIRFYKIDQVPNGFYYDELDAGYQARSIIQTGKDYRGSLSPFYVNSFLDPRPPIPIYGTVLSTLIFNTPELQVRMSSVIVGTINVLLIFWLIYQWFGNFKTSIITAAIFATNPWEIQFSRFNHEGGYVVLFILLGLNLFYKALQTKKSFYLYFSVVIISLGMYTYRAMSLFVPLIFITLLLIYRKEIFRFGLRKVLISLVLIISITVPFLYATTIGAADKPRISQISIFSDPTIPIWVQRDRELDSEDVIDHTIGKKAVLESFFFHNKILSYISSFTNHYLQTFSPNFLFITGDANHRHSIVDQGMLLYVDILALGFGAYLLFSNLKDKKYKLLLTLLLISPIPSSITGDGGGHGARLFVFSPFLLIIIGLGWEVFLTKIKRYPYQKIILSLVVLTWILFFVSYLHKYYIHFPIQSAAMFSYGYKQAVTKIASEEKNYKKVELTQTKDPPMLYYFFWANIPPKQVQDYGTNFSNEVIKNLPLDKYKTSNLLPAGNPDILLRDIQPDTIYLVTKNELDLDLREGKLPPKGIKLIENINYPDGEVGFYIIAKE